MCSSNSSSLPFPIYMFHRVENTREFIIRISCMPSQLTAQLSEDNQFRFHRTLFRFTREVSHRHSRTFKLSPLHH